MDRQLAERMVGAACLLAVLVLVVPAILDGNPDSGATITHPDIAEELDLRTHTIRLDGAEREPPVPTQLQARVDPPPPGEAAPEEPPAPPAAAPEPEPAEAAPAPPEPVTTAPAATAAAVAGSPVTDRAGGDGDWVVQLGSFASQANADRLAARVKASGFQVSVQGGGGSSGTLYRVRAGPEGDRAGAEALAARLAAAGFKGGRVGRK